MVYYNSLGGSTVLTPPWLTHRQIQTDPVTHRQTAFDRLHWQNLSLLEKVAIAMHCNLKWPDVAPDVLGFNYEAHNAPAYTFNNSQRLHTSWTAASLRLMLPVASGSAPQVAISSSCHVIVAPSSAVGHFLLQVRQPGTRLSPRSVA